MICCYRCKASTPSMSGPRSCSGVGARRSMLLRVSRLTSCPARRSDIATLRTTANYGGQCAGGYIQNPSGRGVFAMGGKHFVMDPLFPTGEESCRRPTRIGFLVQRWSIAPAGDAVLDVARRVSCVPCPRSCSSPSPGCIGEKASFMRIPLANHGFCWII
jgi:hypothetical protein